MEEPFERFQVHSKLKGRYGLKRNPKRSQGRLLRVGTGIACAREAREKKEIQIWIKFGSAPLEKIKFRTQFDF